MKTIQTIAMTFALALSLPACTTTSTRPTAVRSSVMTGNPPVEVQHISHSEKHSVTPMPIPVSTNSESLAVVENVDDPGTQSSMKHTVVSIIGQIIVACATSGNCW